MKREERLIKKLEAIRELIRSDDKYYIITTNKNTYQKGSANFLRDNETIRVYEGKKDGSEDHNVTYEEFINNYEFEAQWL